MASIKELAQGRSDLYRVRVTDLHVKEGWNSREIDFNENDPEDLALAKSIAEVGVKQPLTVYMEDGTLYVEDGHRRRAAALYAVAALSADAAMLVPVRMGEKEASEEDRVLSQIIRNSGKHLSPLETGAVFKKLRGLGMLDTEIAAKTGVSRVYVGQLMALVDAPKALLNMVRSGKVTATLAIETLKANKGDGKKAADALKGAVKTAESEGKDRATKKHLKDKPAKGKKARKGAAEGNPILDAFTAATVDNTVDSAGRIVLTMDAEAFNIFASLIGFTAKAGEEKGGADEDII